MNKYEEEILKEQYFVGIGVDREERDFLLSLLSECKDISDSKYKDKIGEVVELTMTREKDDLIHISGSVAYENENRSLIGDILYYKDSIVFDTKMTRLCCNDNDKEYLVLDIFTPNDNGYSLLSRYSGDEAEYIKNIDMKGKVK